jgi:hypothetical protein
MALNEDVQRLLAIAMTTQPQYAVQQAVEFVNSSTETACAAAGQGSDEARELFDVGQAAVAQLQQALAAVQLFYDTCGIVAARHS